jgi:hypothetical protein
MKKAVFYSENLIEQGNMLFYKDYFIQLEKVAGKNKYDSRVDDYLTLEDNRVVIDAGKHSRLFIGEVNNLHELKKLFKQIGLSSK